MIATFVRIGVHVVNVEAVASAHWEEHNLFVHLVGGRFLKLDSDDGEQLWHNLSARAETLGQEPTPN
jgi:hypothetical protein